MPLLTDQLNDALGRVPEPDTHEIVQRSLAAGRRRTRRTAVGFVGVGVAALGLTAVVIGSSLVPWPTTIRAMDPPASAMPTPSPSSPAQLRVAEDMIQIVQGHLPAGVSGSEWSVQRDGDGAYVLSATLTDAHGTTRLSLWVTKKPIGDCNAIRGSLVICELGTGHDAGMMWAVLGALAGGGKSSEAQRRFDDGWIVRLAEENQADSGAKVTRDQLLLAQTTAWDLLKDPAWQLLLQRIG